ncbi:MAG: hypothetical protein KC492_04575 [Myxococcales bacterium]|nr:hypothetical protein [Myxococcales bacterium]
MRCFGGLVVLLGAVGCASPPKKPPDLAADTELACSRSDAAAWTQIVFRTDAWRKLAARADAGDAAAFEEIADHMEAALAAGDTACNASRVERLRETAVRLRDAPRPRPSPVPKPSQTDRDPGEVRGDDDGEVEPTSEVGSPSEAALPLEDEPVEPSAKPPGSTARIPTVRQTDGRLAVYRRVMRQAQARFRRCYQGAHSRQETIQVAVIEFVIAPDGHVEKTSFEGGAGYFDRCMDATFKSLRFPEEAGRLIIRYPLTEVPH